MRGARRLSRRQYPVVDLFRRLEVQYRPSATSSLQRWSSGEVLEDYGALASHRRRYAEAASLGRFLLRETAEGVPCPGAYSALRTALARLAKTSRDASDAILLPAARVGVLIAFLEENGELNRNAFATEDGARLERLLRMATGELPVPRLGATTWSQLDTWVLSLLHDADYVFGNDS